MIFELYLLHALSVLFRERYKTDELDGWLLAIALGGVLAWILGLFDLPTALVIIIVIVWGVVSIAFGARLVAFGRAYKAYQIPTLGVVNIISGILAASVVLVLLLPLAGLASSVVMALIFLEASQQSQFST
ncbi:MAG: hypothetical protein ABDI20_01575 [Candidatus Bipolaricaulaceae bacterium]